MQSSAPVIELIRLSKKSLKEIGVALDLRDSGSYSPPLQ